MKKSEILSNELGYTEPNDLVAKYILESVVPGICTNKDCEAVYDVEPDQKKGYCEECRTPTVKSILILEGY